MLALVHWSFHTEGKQARSIISSLPGAEGEMQKDILTRDEALLPHPVLKAKPNA
jgi:hypothetical protein